MTASFGIELKSLSDGYAVRYDVITVSFQLAEWRELFHLIYLAKKAYVKTINLLAAFDGSAKKVYLFEQDLDNLYHLVDAARAQLLQTKAITLIGTQIAEVQMRSYEWSAVALAMRDGLEKAHDPDDKKLSVSADMLARLVHLHARFSAQIPPHLRA